MIPTPDEFESIRHQSGLGDCWPPKCLCCGQPVHPKKPCIVHLDDHGNFVFALHKRCVFQFVKDIMADNIRLDHLKDPPPSPAFTIIDGKTIILEGL